jgi:hypothetical protein
MVASDPTSFAYGDGKGPRLPCRWAVGPGRASRRHHHLRNKNILLFLRFSRFPGGGPDGGGRWDSIFRSWWWQLSRRDDAILIRFAYSGKSEWHNESIVSLSRSLPPMIPGTNLHMPWGPLPTVRGARCMQNDHYG